MSLIYLITRVVAIGLACVTGGGLLSAAPRPNVLFLAIDDLRCDVGAAGVGHAKTPNLDALAASGRLFTRHYVQVPTCGASRCALLRGRYPEEPAHLGNGAIAATGAVWVADSLPGFLRSHGYCTMALGKVTHYPGGRTGRLWADGPEELPGAWDRSWIPGSPWGAAQNLMHGYANGLPRRSGESPAWQAFDGPDEAFPDAYVARDAVAVLEELAKSGVEQPWFFAVGFFKPHLPFAAPQRWFDLHDPDAIPKPAVTARPEGVSGWHASGEFRRHYAHGGRDPDHDPEYARSLRQAYAAAASYADAQVGRVLDALDRLGLADETVVIAWGDHGFLLGEHAIWGKHCLYEEAVRSPLVIRRPGQPHPGTPTGAVVETVDVFPTIAELCGLPTPPGLHGRSLRPQLDDPATGSQKPAHSFWTRSQRSLRNDRWRLVEHTRDGTAPAYELFDMESDPNEAANAAADHPEVVGDLAVQLERVPTPGR